MLLLLILTGKYEMFLHWPKTVVKKLLSRRRKKISTTTTAAVSTLSCLWSGPPEPALVLDCLNWTVTGATECTQSSHRHGHVVQCDRCFVLCTEYLITFVFNTLRSSRGLAQRLRRFFLLRSSCISFWIKEGLVVPSTSFASMLH